MGLTFKFQKSLFSLAFALGAWSSLAGAAPVAPRAGRMTIGLTGEYFSSRSNFDPNGGSFSNLTNNGSFETFSGHATYEWDFAPHWALHSRLGYLSATANNGITTRSNNSLTEWEFSAQRWLHYRRWALIPQISGAYAFNHVDPNTQDVLTGDGASWAEAGGWAIRGWGLWRVFGYAGFRYRADGLSGLLPFNAGMSYGGWQQRVRGGVRGYISVIDDQDVNNRPLRTHVTAQVDASSLRFYSVNPSSYSLYAGYVYQVTPQLELQAEGSYAFNGSSTARGWTALAGVKFYLFHPPRERRNTPQAHDHSERGFHIHSQKYDQNVFDSSDPTLPPPPPRKIRPNKPAPNIDQMLEKTEDDLD